MDSKSLKKDILIAGSLFLATVLFSLISFSTIKIRPNIFLVAPIVASLLIESAYVFFGFLLALILWLKYTPFFTIEYLIVFILGSISFIVSKLLIFGKVLFVRICLVLIFQALFWLVLGDGVGILSLVFLLEFIYNVIIEELLFALGTWIKKKSF